MKTNIFAENNIFFELGGCEMFKKICQCYKNQTIHIITTPRFEKESEQVLGELKREYKVNISYVAEQLTFSQIGVNTLRGSIRENARLLVAVGDQNVANITKLLAQKMQLKWCFLSYDFPSIFTLCSGGIDAFQNVSTNCNLCLMQNFDLTNASMYSCGYYFGQALTVLYSVFELYMLSKLQCRYVDYKTIKKIITELLQMMKLSKLLQSCDERGMLSFAKSIVKLSHYFVALGEQSVIIKMSKQILIETGGEMSQMAILNFLELQILCKALKSYFGNGLCPSLSVKFDDILKMGFSKTQLMEVMQSEKIEEKTQYILSANMSEIQMLLEKIDALVFSGAQIVKRILPDGGYEMQNMFSYGKLISCVKTCILQSQNSFFQNINLLKIV